MSLSSRSLLLLAVAGSYVAYLFYGNVPSDINERFKYRTVVAYQKFLLHMVAIRSLWDDSPAIRIRRFRDCLTVTRMFLPSGSSYGPEVKVTKVTADGVKVHIYQPPGSDSGPALPGFIYIHGGGLALFDAEHYDGLTRKIAKNLNAVVMSIDYLRPPDCVFPVPFEESLTATKWFMRHSDEYNVDVARMAIGGDSAGGYLSATVSQAITDDKTIPNIKLQVLIYPWLQILDLNTPSYQKHQLDFGSNSVMPRDKVAIYSALHLFGTDTTEDIVRNFSTNNHISGDFRNSKFYQERLSHQLVPENLRGADFYAPPLSPVHGSAGEHAIWDAKREIFLDPRLTPFFRDDLSGVPPAYIVTMGYDPLRDDGIMYAEHLKKAGIDVTWRNYPSSFHGAVWAAPGINFKDADVILQEMYDFIIPRL